MKSPVLLIAAAFFVFACGDKKPAEVSAKAAAKDTAAAPKQFFPVMGFIKGEVAYVDSLPVGIKKYRGDNKKTFSYIKPEEFHRLAMEFTPKEMEDSFFLSHYQETSFLDRSTNTGTFLYVSKDPSLSLQRVDVITAKGDAYDQVKSIYLQKNYRSGDTTFIKKLFWRPQKSFQTITETVRGGGQPQTEVINVVWDNREEE